MSKELQCTYISIPQVSETFEVLLSQPWWMWGAEMGVNEHGVVIGNEAVFSHETSRSTGLLGMDLLRLGLERGDTAMKTITIMTQLLEKYHQGGGCAYNDPSWTYHNSYIIADTREAYVLETADDWWIVERVKAVRTISNELSIRGKGDLRREGIIQHAVDQGYCKDDNAFDFASTFTGSKISEIPSPYSRGGKSTLLLRENKGKITPKLMMEFLREHDAGICMHGGFESTGSQISHLRKEKKSIHWFTGSTLPCLSLYKPYIFPIGDQRILEPGPYSKINPKWFWCQHSSAIASFKGWGMGPERKNYLRNLEIVENDIITKMDEILLNDNNFSNEEFDNKIKSINSSSWEKSFELIAQKSN